MVEQRVEESSVDATDLVADLASSNDPRKAAAMLRRQPLVRFGELTMITRRENVEAALRDPVTFSSGFQAMQLGNIRPLIPLQIDPPKHVKYRRVLDPLFAPKKMLALEGDVSALANDLIDRFAPQGSCDFHSDFAVPLPCTVFLHLMGLPLDDLDLFLSMKDGIIRPGGEAMPAEDDIRREAAMQIYEYFERIVAIRRRTPGDDLLSKIMMAEIDGQELTDDEILDVCFLFIIAGLDTVTDSLDCIFAHLAQHAGQRRQLVEDPSLAPSAIEELLRWESPVPAVPRVATRDTEVGGCPVRAGEQVILALAAANTDGTNHPAADQVELARNPNPHLAFGGGVHRCLGSHLARTELRAAMATFHQRIPDYEVAPGAVLEYTPGLRSLHELPLVFSASR